MDPFAGSYVVEAMTDEVELAALDLLARTRAYGSAVEAIEAGFQKGEIERSAYQIAQEIDSGERVVVGLNRFTLDEEEPYQPLRVDPELEKEQAARLATLRAERDSDLVTRRLEDLRTVATGTGNVMPVMREALRARATVGEVCDALRGVWGLYRPNDRL